MKPLLAIVWTALLMSVVRADNWPGWRGPQQNGLSTEVSLPLSWSKTENIHWKIPLPGVGHSSPIVWENDIFVTTSAPDDLSRRVLRIDRESGRVIWNRVVAVAPLEEMHRDNSSASTTPVTDGKFVYVSFCVDGRLLVAALTFDGEVVWQIYPGTFASLHGYCTSLVLDGNRLFLSGLQDGDDAFVAALDSATGNPIWKTSRGRKVRSFSTPFLCDIDQQPALLLSGAEQTVAYERSSGKVLFVIDGPASKTVSSIVACAECQLAFVCGGRDNQFFAIKLCPSGDQVETAGGGIESRDSASRIAWRASKGIPYMNSPLASHGLLHVLSDEGVYRCYRAATGELLNERRAVGPLKASMVATPNHIFITELNGRTTVIANEAAYNVVATNDLDEEVVASPAISNGDFILRTRDHLWLVRETR